MTLLLQEVALALLRRRGEADERRQQGVFREQPLRRDRRSTVVVPMRRDPPLPEEQLFPVAAQELGAVVADAVVADDHASGRAGDEEIHAGERRVQEEARRGRRPHVVPSGEARRVRRRPRPRRARRPASKLAWCGACPGVISARIPSSSNPWAGTKRSGRDGLERPVPVRDRAQHLARAFPELGWVDQVRDALVVADDARLREARGDVAGRPRVVEVDVGEQDVVQPRHAERRERGGELVGGGRGADVYEAGRRAGHEPAADEVPETGQRRRGERYHEDMITEGSNVVPHGQHLHSGKRVGNTVT